MPAGPIAHSYSQLGLTPTAAVTAAERAVGCLTEAKMTTVLDTFSRQGVVVLEAVIGHKALDQLRLMADANIVRAAVEPDGLQLSPRAHPWVLPEIIANPIVESVASALLGSTTRLGCQLVAYGAGEGKLPGDCVVQDIHCDNHWDWRTDREAAAADQPWPHDTMSLVANFGCEDITLERGATSIWPCSHKVLSVAKHDRGMHGHGDNMDMEVYWGAEMAEAVAHGETWPARMTMSKGSVTFRDTRTWHHAVPMVGTTANDIRYQNTLVYARKPSGRTRPRADDSVRPPTSNMTTSVCNSVQPFLADFVHTLFIKLRFDQHLRRRIQAHQIIHHASLKINMFNWQQVGVVRREGGDFAHFSWSDLKHYNTGADYAPLQFDRRAREAIEIVPQGLIDRNIEWVEWNNCLDGHSERNVELLGPSPPKELMQAAFSEEKGLAWTSELARRIGWVPPSSCDVRARF